MKPIWPAALLVVGLSGCAGLAVKGGVVAGGAALGWVTAASAANQDADEALGLAKPFNEAACILHPWNPQSDEAKAAVAAYCANLPDNTGGFLVQQLRIIEAIDAAHDAAEKAKKDKTP